MPRGRRGRLGVTENSASEGERGRKEVIGRIKMHRRRKWADGGILKRWPRAGGESSAVIYGQVRRITGGPKKRSKIDPRKSVDRLRVAVAAGVSNTCRQSSRYNVRRLCAVGPRLMRKKTNGKSCSIPGPSRINCRRFRNRTSCGRGSKIWSRWRRNYTRSRVVHDETFIRESAREHIRRLKSRCGKKTLE